MDLPKDLSKYEKYVEILIDRDKRAGSYKNLSNFLLRQILESKDGKMMFKVKTDLNQFEYYMPSLNEIPNCFEKRIWDYATFEDKIKIVDKYLDFLFQKDKSNRPSIRIISNPSNKVDKLCLANYNRSENEIYLNLDLLDNCTGLKFMAVLFHECAHARDMANIRDNIMPEILHKYTPLSKEASLRPNIFEKLIIDMPIDDMLFNKLSKEKEYSQGAIQQKILKCKNYFSVFNESTLLDPDLVNNKGDFERYMKSILYWYSPLERFARVSVRNFFRTQLNDNQIIMDEDKKIAKALINEEVHIDESLNKFKQFLIRPTSFGGHEHIVDMKQLFDLASKYKFYCERGSLIMSNEKKYPSQAKAIKEEYRKVLNDLYINFKYLMREERGR